MTKLNQNLVLTLLLASLISYSHSIEQTRVDPVPLQPAKSKIYIEEPVLVDVQKSDPIKTDNNVPEAKPIEPIADINDDEIKPKEDSDNKPVDSVHLEPIPLMMEPQLPFMDKFPPFLQSILGSIRSQNPFGGSDLPESNKADTSEETDSSDDSKKVKHGSMTILLMKSLNNQNMEPGSSQDQPKPSGVKSSFIIFKYAPKRLGGSDDPDNPNNDMMKKPMHLLGGKHDIDMKYFDMMNKQKNQLGGGDFDVDKIKDMPLIGADDVKMNNMMNGVDEEQPKSMISFFNSIRDYIRNKFEQDPNTQSMENQPAFIIKTDNGQSAIIPNEAGFGHPHPKKQCMMLSFMRLKASVYYRTILHLLFFTGVLLFILCLIMLTLKTYKRRRALRYYSQNMNVSTIDGAVGEDEVKADPTKSNRLFLFRMGSLRNSYAQRDLKSSVLIQAPPAYDQVVLNGEEKKLSQTKLSSSPLVGSLASDYKARFSRLNSSDEAVDTKSLPDYEESVKQKKDDGQN